MKQARINGPTLQLTSLTKPVRYEYWSGLIPLYALFERLRELKKSQDEDRPRVLEFLAKHGIVSRVEPVRRSPAKAK